MKDCMLGGESIMMFLKLQTKWKQQNYQLT